MTVRNPPMWLENRTDHHGEEYRNLLDALIAEREGIAAPGDMKVTQLPTPSRDVRVALGGCFVKGDDAADQGAYFIWNDANLDLAIAAADATNPRKDIVVCRVKDAEYTGAINAASIEVITGTPAVTPAEPALPATAHKLAVLDVAAGATSITDANITDTRLRTAALGGIIPVVSTAKPSHQQAQAIYLTDKNRLEISTGSIWRRYGDMELIERQVLGSDVAQIDFNSIPQTYDHLIYRFIGRGTAAIAAVDTRIRVNGLATGEYDEQRFVVAGTGISAERSVNVSSGRVGGLVSASAGDPDNQSQLTGKLYNYTGTTFSKTLETQSFFDRGDVPELQLTGVNIDVGAAITSLRLFPDSGSFKTGSRAWLYGVRGD